MKKYLKFACFALIVGVILPFTACKDDDKEEYIPRPDCDIVEFKITSLNLTGEIDAEAKTVTIRVAPDYENMDDLKNAVPLIQISSKATISPATNVVQDFTKDVKYTVTAEDGTIKEWTVKLVLDPHVKKGIGSYTKAPQQSGNDGGAWYKTAEQLGLSANGEATIATSDDVLVGARSGLLINRLTGEALSEKLNMTGIVANPANDVTNVAFTLANDDAGNLIGCTLGAWGIAVNPPTDFKVYKWTSPSADPVEFISHPQSTTSHFGRKLAAVGDVNGKAIVTSYDCAGENTAKPGSASPGPANHTYWTITGGQAGTGQLVTTNYNSGDIQQILWPASSNAIRPFYFSDRGASDASPITTIKYIDANGVETTLPKGPVPDSEITNAADDMFKQTGWGRKVLFTQVFSFNNNKYMAVLSYYDDVSASTVTYYIAVLDLENNYESIIYDKRTYSGTMNALNANATGGFAVSKPITQEDGKTIKMHLYGLMTSSGIVCYELSNLAKTN